MWIYLINVVSYYLVIFSDLQPPAKHPPSLNHTSIESTRLLGSHTSKNYRFLCERLLLDEKDYVTLLKIKQKERLKQQYRTILREHFLTNRTSEKILYALEEKERKKTRNSPILDETNKGSFNGKFEHEDETLNSVPLKL